MFKICDHCSHKNILNAQFCVKCGASFEGIVGSSVACPNCGADNNPTNSFCSGCGSRLDGDGASVNAYQWQLDQGDYAVDVNNFEPSLLHRGGVVVEQGTRALLFKDGKFVEELSPGHHKVTKNKFFERLLGTGPSAKVVLIDDGASKVRFYVEGVKTADPLFVNVECQAGLKLDDPSLFYVNLYKRRTNLSLVEIGHLLSDEVREALGEELGRQSVRDIATSKEFKGRVEQALERHLGQTLRQYGLRLQHLHTFSISHLAYDEISKKQEEYLIEAWSQESALVGRKKLFEVKSEENLQGIFEATKQAEVEEGRLEAMSRLRKAVNAGKMDEVRSEEELAAFLSEVLKEKELREEEMEEFARAFREKKEDRERTREHLLGKLDVERKIELRRMSLVGTKDLDSDLLKMDMQTERVKLDHKLAMERQEAEVKREERQKDNLARLEMELKQAETDQQKEYLALEVEKAKADLGQTILEKQRASKVTHEREVMLVEAERADLELKRRLSESQYANAAQIEYVKTLSQLSPEALIAASSDSKAAMLTELKKTEMLGSWTEEQILAEAAKNSPEVAKAFQERFRGMAAEEAKGLYERMLNDKDSMLNLYREDQKDSRKDMKEITLEAMRSGKTDTNVVYPPMGGGYAMGQAGGAVGPFCPHCGGKLQPGSCFCGNCGNKV